MRAEKGVVGRVLAGFGLLLLGVVVPVAVAQSTGSQNQAPAKPQSSQDIPDAPSAVQPPAPKPTPEPQAAPANPQNAAPPDSSSTSEPPSSEPVAQQPAGAQQQTPPPPMPPVQTVPAGAVPPGDSPSAPKNQVNPSEPLYKLRVTTNFVQVPVSVRDSQNRLVYGLTWKDFTVNENGKPQTLTYFTSDPFPLSVAIVLNNGLPEVTLSRVNETYGSLVGALSPYDEASLYTYSSAVTQVADFTAKREKLTAALDEMKLIRGRNNGPPVLGGPLGPQPPMVNGIPVGTSGPPPVYTPPKESHVLNDAILRAALDLSKRSRSRRKVIFVISDGRERGSQASYKDVLQVLEKQDIQVKAVVLDMGALPGYKQVEKLPHVFRQGYSNILPKYSNATGGGDVFTELSRNSIEDAYAQITSEARNQYTLGYRPAAIASSTAYRAIEVVVHRKSLDVFAKQGYYPIPAAR